MVSFYCLFSLSHSLADYPLSLSRCAEVDTASRDVTTIVGSIRGQPKDDQGEIFDSILCQRGSGESGGVSAGLYG